MHSGNNDGACAELGGGNGDVGGSAARECGIDRDTVIRYACLSQIDQDFADGGNINYNSLRIVLN